MEIESMEFSEAKAIKFKDNLNNKLKCDTFTAILPYHCGPYNVGEQYEIVENLGRIELCHGEALVSGTELAWARELTDRTCLLDAGMKREELLKYLESCYPNMEIRKYPFYIVTLTYNEDCGFCGANQAPCRIGDHRVCKSCYDDYRESRDV